MGIWIEEHWVPDLRKAGQSGAAARTQGTFCAHCKRGLLCVGKVQKGLLSLVNAVLSHGVQGAVMILAPTFPMARAFVQGML